jgi:hypothetical protein
VATEDEPVTITAELLASLVNTARYALDTPDAFHAWIDSYYRQAGRRPPDDVQKAIVLDHTREAADLVSSYLRSVTEVASAHPGAGTSSPAHSQ